MKKFIYVLVTVLFILALTGCSGGSSGALPEEEYYVYENGKLIAASTEFEDDRFYYEVEQKNDYAGRDLTTKRDIKIGSTLRELADAYKGIPAKVMGSESVDIPFNQYLDKSSEYNIGNEYMVVYSTYIIDGKLYSDDTFDSFLKNKGIERIDYAKDMEKYMQEWNLKLYRLNFMIEDNFVKSIIIMT